MVQRFRVEGSKGSRVQGSGSNVQGFKGSGSRVRRKVIWFRGSGFKGSGVELQDSRFTLDNL